MRGTDLRVHMLDSVQRLFSDMLGVRHNAVASLFILDLEIRFFLPSFSLSFHCNHSLLSFLRLRQRCFALLPVVVILIAILTNRGSSPTYPI